MPGISRATHARLWQTPLLVVLIGLAITAFAAHLTERASEGQATRLFEAQHQGLSVRIDTLETHAKSPGFQFNTGHRPAEDRTVRSEVTLAGDTWLVSSTPDQRWLDAHTQIVSRAVWLSGLTISAAGALLCELDENGNAGFVGTLEAARQDRQLQRLDLTLVDASQQPVPVTLRVLALHDTLHGFSGFRLTLHPH